MREKPLAVAFGPSAFGQPSGLILFIEAAEKTLIATTFLFILLSGACTMGDPVVGTWEITTTREQVINLTGEWDGRARLRFDADGKYSSVGDSGTWRRIDDNRIKLENITGSFGLRVSQTTKDITIKIEGNLMTWTDGDRTTMWRRAR